MNQNEQPKKILCLHGFATNSDFLSFQIQQLKKEFKEIEFIAIDGPQQVSKKIITDEKLAKFLENQEIYSWATFQKMKQADFYKGFEKGIEMVVKILEEQGPFAGIMGFSQGSHIVAKMTDSICAGQEYVDLCDIFRKIKLSYKLKYVIFVSGMPYQYVNFNTNLYQIPSLHFIGINDFLADRSIGLAAQFLNPFTIYHNQGHRIPLLTYEQIKQVRQFLNQNGKEDWSKSIYIPKL